MKNQLSEKRGIGKFRRDGKLSTKVSKAEDATIRELAKKFAGGSVAQWMRIASLKFKPMRGDFDEGI